MVLHPCIHAAYSSSVQDSIQLVEAMQDPPTKSPLITALCDLSIVGTTRILPSSCWDFFLFLLPSQLWFWGMLTQHPGAHSSFAHLIACGILMPRRLPLSTDCISWVCPDCHSIMGFFSVSQVLDGLLAQYGTVENCEQGKAERRSQHAVV